MEKLNENYLKLELYERIRMDNSLFDFIQEVSLDGMWYWNLEAIKDGWISPKFWDVLGYNNESMEENDSVWQEIIFEDDFKASIENYKNHLSDKNHPFDQIIRFKHKNESTIWVRCRGIVIRDAMGKAIRMLGTHTNITDYKQKEFSLIESENRFKILHNASFGGIAVHDKGYILDCNQGLSDISGFSMMELVGMNGLLLIAPEYRDFVMDKIVKGYEKPYEAYGIRKNSEIYPLKLEARNIPYEGKQVRVVEFRDITELKQKEDLLIESEDKFRKLFEHAPFGYQSLDISGHFIEVNHRWLEIMGYQKDEVIGKWFGDFLTPEAKQQFKKRFEIFKENGHVHSEFQMKTKQGDIIRVGFEGNISYDQNNTFIQTHCTVTDITEITIANTKLSQRNALIEGLFNHMTPGVAIYEVMNDGLYGRDYIIKDFNDTSLRWENKTRNDVIGKSIIALHPNIEESGIIEIFRQVWKTGKAIIYPARQYVNGNYNRWHDNRIFKLPSGEIVAMYDDVTERVIIEQQRAKEQRDLLTSQKIAKLGTWRLDIKTNEVTWSEELYKMYGFDPTQPVPPYTQHMKLFTKQSWEQLSASLALTSTQGIPYELELEMALEDESKGWMWVRGEAEYDDQGQIISLTGAAQNITEKKLKEEEISKSYSIIKEQQRMQETLISNLPGMAYRCKNDHDFTMVFISNQVTKITGYTSRDFYQNRITYAQLIHPKDIDMVYERCKEKESINLIYRIIDKDGNTKWVRENAKHIEEKPGKKARFIEGFIEDITTEKLAEEEIIYTANHDYLTNLYNRRYFVNAFITFVSKDCCPAALMMIDINGLKIINDAYGHVRGDEAIKRVADLLMEVFDQEDVVARIGGDEFAVLIHCKNDIELQAYKDQLVTLSSDIQIDNIPVSLAIGYEVLKESDKNLDDLLSRAENHLYRHKVSVGESIRNHAIKAILNTLTEKYKEEKIHSERVSLLCKQIGTELGLNKEDLDILELAGMYHDIGKISIPDAILNKPDKLTNEEYEIIKTHTQIGYQILRAADEYSGLAEYALSHHERWDGKGYPKGLKGDEIPLFSRIINVSDSFEAMTADRPYRKGMSLKDAIDEIKRCSGSQFDPKIADLFLLKVLHV